MTAPARSSKNSRKLAPPPRNRPSPTNYELNPIRPYPQSPQPVPNRLSPPQVQALSPTATVGGVSAAVQHAGTAPGLVNGMMQVNIQIPQVALGPQPLVILMGTASSQPYITVAVK